MQLVILIALKPASHHNSKEMTTSKRKKRMHRIAAKWVEIGFGIVFLFKIQQSSIYYAGSLGRWNNHIIDQVSDVPSVFFS